MDNLQSSVPHGPSQCCDRESSGMRRISHPFQSVVRSRQCLIVGGHQIDNRDSGFWAAYAHHFCDLNLRILKVVDRKSADDHIECVVWVRQVLGKPLLEGNVCDSVFYGLVASLQEHLGGQVHCDDSFYMWSNCTTQVAGPGRNVQHVVVRSEIQIIHHPLQVLTTRKGKALLSKPWGLLPKFPSQHLVMALFHLQNSPRAMITPGRNRTTLLSKMQKRLGLPPVQRFSTDLMQLSSLGADRSLWVPFRLLLHQRSRCPHPLFVTRILPHASLVGKAELHERSSHFRHLHHLLSKPWLLKVSQRSFPPLVPAYLTSKIPTPRFKGEVVSLSKSR